MRAIQPESAAKSARFAGRSGVTDNPLARHAESGMGVNLDPANHYRQDIYYSELYYCTELFSGWTVAFSI